ncbi:cell death protein 3-like isoform X2 [Lineus longissimus]
MILNQEAILRGKALPPAPNDQDVTDFTPTSGVLDLNVSRTSDDFIQNFNKDIPHYRMSSHPRGYALLINNRKFGYMSERVGTEIDGTNLENLLKQLGYQVEQKRELTAQEIRTAVRQFAVKPQLNQVDSCVFAIMTHGENGEVYGVDDELVPLDSLVQLFEGEHCPALVNKPKMFIIQACRGKKKDAGFAGFDATDSVPPVDMEKTISDFQRMSIDDVAVLKQKLPTLTDTLIAYSTIPGYVSWRNTTTGSWFIQSICEIFAEHAHHQDALSLLTMVNDKMSRAFGTQYKQTPAPVFTFRKKLFFFPGL